MKNKVTAIILLIASLFLSGCTKGIEDARSHYTKLAFQSTNSVQLIHQPVDAEFIKEIEEGIAFSDGDINAALIRIVRMKSARFTHDLPLKKNPKELSEFRSITGLQGFITDQLAVEKPNKEVILTSAILYGYDTIISDRLLELYTAKNDLAIIIIRALWAGNLTDSKFKPIILQAIASDDADLACAAAQYLTNNPLPEALPALIKQYQQPDSALNLTPAINSKVDPYDIWRMLVGRAVRAYDHDALQEYESELRSIEKTVTFGRMSGGTYQSILIKLSN